MKTPPGEQVPPRRTARFGLQQLFLLTLVVAVTAAGYGGMRRGGVDRVYFVLFAAASPLLVLVGVAVWTAYSRQMRRARKRRHAQQPGHPLDGPPGG